MKIQPVWQWLLEQGFGQDRLPEAARHYSDCWAVQRDPVGLVAAADVYILLTDKLQALVEEINSIEIPNHVAKEDLTDQVADLVRECNGTLQGTIGADSEVYWYPGSSFEDAWHERQTDPRRN